MTIDARPLREARRPAECTGGPRCWVEIGAPGLEARHHNKMQRCLACGAQPGLLPGDFDSSPYLKALSGEARCWARFPITSHKPGR